MTEPLALTMSGQLSAAPMVLVSEPSVVEAAEVPLPAGQRVREDQRGVVLVGRNLLARERRPRGLEVNVRNCPAHAGNVGESINGFGWSRRPFDDDRAGGRDRLRAGCAGVGQSGGPLRRGHIGVEADDEFRALAGRGDRRGRGEAHGKRHERCDTNGEGNDEADFSRRSDKADAPGDDTRDLEQPGRYPRFGSGSQPGGQRGVHRGDLSRNGTGGAGLAAGAPESTPTGSSSTG